MNVSQCMSTDVRVCAPEDTVRQAAQTMAEIDAGILPVGENDRLIGMVTDRDIAVRGVGEGRGPETEVREVMSQDVLYCYDDAELDDVALQMSDLQVRRLPVVNRDKRLVGMISIGDISKAGDGHAQRASAALSGIAQPSERHSQH